MSLLPAYMSDLWRCYEEMRSESLGLIDVSLVSTDPESCHSAVLPFLAWECDVDISGVSQERARLMIRAAFDAMQYAGTIKALRAPVEALSESVKVSEWFEYDGDAFNFIVEVDSSQQGLSAELIEKIEKTAQKQKNVRSNIESIKINMFSMCDMHHLLSTTSGESGVIYPYFPQPIELVAFEQIGAAMHNVDTTVIYPQEGE